MSDAEFDRLDFLCVRAGYIRRLFAEGESAEEVAEATQCNDIGQVKLIALTHAVHTLPGAGIRAVHIRGQIEALEWVRQRHLRHAPRDADLRDRIAELRKELE